MTIGARLRFGRIGALVVLSRRVREPAARGAAERACGGDGETGVCRWPGADRAGFPGSTAWIRQTLWVETEFDSDGDGKRDRMFVDVTRPKQTDTEGLKVPVHLRVVAVLRRHVRRPREFLWDVKQEVGDGAAAAHVASRRFAFKPDARQRLDSLVSDVGAARLRGRALGGAGHRPVAGLLDGRRHDPENSRRRPSSTG